MRIVVDGMPTEAGSSLAVILEHLLEGWVELGGDELHLVISPRAGIAVPPEVTVHTVDSGRWTMVDRFSAQTRLVPRLCRELRADALLGVTPTTTVLPLPCPRVVILYDLRHEVLPEQFPWKSRLLRKVGWGLGFRQADGIAAISQRTKDDLLRSRPRLADGNVRVAPLGGDHVAGWPVDRTGEGYALAFGQWGNKNVDMVIDGWGELLERGEDPMPLKLIGMSEEAQAKAQEHIDRRGLTGLAQPTGWLFGDDLQRCFASAELMVFPSSFEGFGMPPVEAMRLGIPVVITPEAAMLEVTAGLVTVMDGFGPGPLADAVVRARGTTPAQLDAARARAEEFTWRRMAEEVRRTIEVARTGRGA